MRTPTRSPTPYASQSRHCANASANPGSSPPWPASGTASALNQTPDVREETVDRAPGLSVRRKLADAVDTMVARLEAHIAEQQRFAANASHELRTPLSITKTLLDVARNDPARGTGELIERLHTVNAQAIGLTEALLLLGRADQ